MKKILILQVFVISVSLVWASSPSVFAQESAENQLDVTGIALIGNGVGEFTCGNGKQFDNVKIFVLLSEATRAGLGSGPSGMGLKSGDQNLAVKLNTGTVDSENFHVEGILLVDDLCQTDSPVNFSADGICGEEKNITVKVNNGSFGNFQSTVSCN